jgi:RNA polymerase sigma-70 factor, ECF subfamily
MGVGHARKHSKTRCVGVDHAIVVARQSHACQSVLVLGETSFIRRRPSTHCFHFRVDEKNYTERIDVTASALFPTQHVSLISLTYDESAQPTYGARSLQRTTDSVLTRVAQGDPGALHECIDRFGSLIWSMARRLARTHADAEDAVQEIFSDVWRSAGRFDPEQGSESVFVAMIARRRLIDRMRRSRGRRAEFVSDISLPEWADAGSSVEACAEAQAAARAITRLRPELRQVLELGVLHGLNHSEIADVLQLPLDMVKSMMRRGLMQVRELMGQQGA